MSPLSNLDHHRKFAGGAVNVGTECLALYESKWYRGRVTAINDEQVEVYFLDYGNTEVCSLASIRDRHSDFASHPSAAFRGVQSSREWSVTECQQMQKFMYPTYY